MQDYITTKGKHLTYPERLLIERWKNKDKKSNRRIAKLLGKAPQTIHNELKRGLVDLSFHDGGMEYSADVAQEKYSRRMNILSSFILCPNQCFHSNLFLFNLVDFLEKGYVKDGGSYDLSKNFYS